MFLITLGVDIWGVVAAAIVAAVLSRLIKLEQLSRVTLAVCMVTLLIRPDHVVSYGLYRFLNTLIGAGVGLGVSLLVWPVRAEVAATQAVSKLLLQASHVLETVGKPPPEGEEETDQTELQLGKVFKAIRDARREGQVFRMSATATAERAILGGQVGLGAIAVASGCERLRQNASAAPFVAAVMEASGRLAERVVALTKRADSAPRMSPFLRCRHRRRMPT